MEVANMKAALACLLLLAGSACSIPVESKILPDWIVIPEYVPDWWPITDKPDWWPESIPAHPEWIPWPIEKPDWWPESIPPHPEWIPWPIEKPDWWPESIPPHPEWIPWPIEKPDWWPESIPPHPEWIPWPIEKPDWWPESIPPHPEWIPWPPQINEVERGTPAAIEEFPGIVQVEVGFGSIWAQGCAGSVLTSLHVLSAARCFSGRNFETRFRRIRAGSSRRSTDGVVIGVERVANHPSFGDTSENFFDGDIAIVRLQSSFVFGGSIQQTPIVSAGFNLGGGVTVTQAGWGSTAQGDKITDRDLNKINLVSVDNAECSNTWSTLIPFDTIKVTDNMICVAQSDTGGRDSDLRDIGAPIYFDNILVGVVSWGNIFGNQRFPTVATAVSSYTNWIVENAV